jgi:hypothetical protein
MKSWSTNFDALALAGLTDSEALEWLDRAAVPERNVGSPPPPSTDGTNFQLENLAPMDPSPL